MLKPLTSRDLPAGGFSAEPSASLTLLLFSALELL